MEALWNACIWSSASSAYHFHFKFFLAFRHCKKKQKQHSCLKFIVQDVMELYQPTTNCQPFKLASEGLSVFQISFSFLSVGELLNVIQKWMSVKEKKISKKFSSSKFGSDSCKCAKCETIKALHLWIFVTAIFDPLFNPTANRVECKQSYLSKLVATLKIQCSC